MKIIDIVKRTNKYLAGEQLTYDKLLPFLDDAIDDINTQLNATFPTFSDLEITNINADTAVYNYFPDKYIRTVVTLGAAHYFYEMDEEGNTYDMSYADRYERNLFYMVRDYVEQIPEEYVASETGSVVFNEDDWFQHNNALGRHSKKPDCGHENNHSSNTSNTSNTSEVINGLDGDFFPLMGLVSPESYGAVGDGQHDDGPALQKALESGKPVILTKDLYINTPVFIKKSKVVLNGQGYTIHANFNNVMVDNDGNNVYEVLTFSAHSITSENAPLRAIYDDRNVYISDLVHGERLAPDPALTDTIKMGYLSYNGRVPFPVKYQNLMDEEYLVVKGYSYSSVIITNLTIECTKCRGRFGLSLNHLCDSEVRNVKVISTDGEGQVALNAFQCYNLLLDHIRCENFWANYTWMNASVDPVYGRGNSGYGMIITGDNIRVRDYTGWNTKSNLTIGGDRSVWTTNVVVDGMHCGWEVDPDHDIRTSLDGSYSTWKYESAWNCHEDVICPIINNVTIDSENSTKRQYPFAIRCPEAIINNVNITAPEGQINFYGICETVHMNNVIAPTCTVSLGWSGATIIVQDLIAVNCHLSRVENGNHGNNNVSLSDCIIEQRVHEVNHLRAVNTVFYSHGGSDWSSLIPIYVFGEAHLTGCVIYANRAEFLPKTQPIIKAPDDMVFLANCRAFIPFGGNVFKKGTTQTHIEGLYIEDIRGFILDDFKFGVLDENNIQ